MMDVALLSRDLRERLAAQLRRASEALAPEDAGVEALALARNSAAAALLIIDALQPAPAQR